MPTELNDVLRMTTGVNTIHAGGGDDTLHWTPELGSYTFHGGDTNERYDTNVYGDKTGGDRLIIDSKLGLRVTFTSTEDGRIASGKSVLNFTGVERLHSGDGDDVINASKAVILPGRVGTPQHGLTVYAGDGNDNITGSRADDFIDGGAGNDTIRAGDGWDFIQSSTGNDLIYGGAGQDNIRWGQGNPDEIIGNDTVYGGADGDLMNVWVRDWNGDGVEVTITGPYSGTAWTDIGGARSTLQFFGMETVWTHEGADTILGADARVGADNRGFQVNTRWGDDRITGSRGNDTIEGGEGADTIEAGAGNDLISTNGDYYRRDAPADGDADVLIFHRGFGHDTVLAFDVDTDIMRFDAGMTYTARETGNGTLMTFNTGDTIMLENVFDLI